MSGIHAAVHARIPHTIQDHVQQSVLAGEDSEDSDIITVGSGSERKHRQYDPLLAAIEKSDQESVRGLLRNGADVNVRGGFFSNPLQTASAYGEIEIVQMLLEKGADVHTQGGHCGGALQAASATGHLETVQLLLKYGANIDTQGGHYGGALPAAFTQGHFEIAY